MLTRVIISRRGHSNRTRERRMERQQREATRNDVIKRRKTLKPSTDWMDACHSKAQIAFICFHFEQWDMTTGRWWRRWWIHVVWKLAASVPRSSINSEKKIEKNSANDVKKSQLEMKSQTSQRDCIVSGLWMSWRCNRDKLLWHFVLALD